MIDYLWALAGATAFGLVIIIHTILREAELVSLENLPLSLIRRFGEFTMGNLYRGIGWVAGVCYDWIMFIADYVWTKLLGALADTFLDLWYAVVPYIAVWRIVQAFREYIESIWESSKPYLTSRYGGVTIAACALGAALAADHYWGLAALLNEYSEDVLMITTIITFVGVVAAAIIAIIMTNDGPVVMLHNDDDSDDSDGDVNDGDEEDEDTRYASRLRPRHMRRSSRTPGIHPPVMK